MPQEPAAIKEEEKKVILEKMKKELIRHIVCFGLLMFAAGFVWCGLLFHYGVIS